MRYDTIVSGTMSRRDRNALFFADDPDKDPSPEPPEIDDESSYLWEWFWVLSDQRSKGKEPLSTTDIQSWSNLTGLKLSQEEFRVLLDMDRAFVAAINIELNEAREAQKSGAKK